MNNETLPESEASRPMARRPTDTRRGLARIAGALRDRAANDTPPGKPTRLIGSGPVVASVAAAVVLVLIGGLALLINNPMKHNPPTRL